MDSLPICKNMTSILKNEIAPLCRFRFPSGYSGYNPNLPTLLKDKRGEKRLTQQKLADRIGIARASLIAIEKGYAWPSPDTMEKLAHQLELKPGEIYLRGPSNRTPRFDPHDDEDADRRLDLGAALRAGRRLENLKLRQVAEICDISVAQLSRIERGELTRSRCYKNDGQSLRFSNAEMQRLANLVS